LWEPLLSYSVLKEENTGKKEASESQTFQDYVIYVLMYVLTTPEDEFRDTVLVQVN
jgi:hypothetical protein